MSTKYYTPEEHRALLEEEISKWPDQFGLAAFPGETFRISRTSSYFASMTATVPTLYTEKMTEDGLWSDFAKGTPSELRRQMVRINWKPPARDMFFIPEDGAYIAQKSRCELKTLQLLVGGYIEIVNLPIDVIKSLETNFQLDFLKNAPNDSRIVMVVNDDWQRHNCGLNQTASILANQHIRGAVVICALD